MTIVKITNQAGDTDLFTFDGVVDHVTNIEDDFRPVWAEQQIPRKKGNNRQFLGSQDGELILSFAFTGNRSDKLTKKDSLKTIAQAGDIVRVDTGGADPTIEGTDYVLLRANIPQQNFEVWVGTLLFREYNN